jgi:hypothetical protein
LRCRDYSISEFPPKTFFFKLRFQPWTDLTGIDNNSSTQFHSTHPFVSLLLDSSHLQLEEFFENGDPVCGDGICGGLDFTDRPETYLLIAVLALHLCAVMESVIDSMEKHGHLENQPVSIQYLSRELTIL